MAQNSFALMTNLGRAKEAAALANGTAIVITHIAIGDGATVPSGGETSLYNEVARKAISGHGTVVGAANTAYFDIFLAAADGPYTIREAGLYDNAGDLIAIARYDPPISKPVPSSGQTVEGTVRLQVAFSNIANVTIVVDPSFTAPLQRLSRLPWIPVLSMSVTAPPANPVLGEAYLVPTGATGSWAGQSGKIAEYTAAGWGILTPPDGHGISLPDGRVFERIDGSYIEKFALDTQVGKWNFATTTGNASSMVAALVPAPVALVDGLRLYLKPSVSPAANATLNLNGLGAKPVMGPDGTRIRLGDMAKDTIAELVFSTAIDGWALLSSARIASQAIGFKARGTLTTSLPGPGVTTKIMFEEAVYTAGTGLSLGSSSYSVPMRGVYTFAANFYVEDVTNTCILYLRKNGVVVAETSSNTRARVLAVSTSEQCAAGDNIDVAVRHGFNGTMILDPTIVGFKYPFAFSGALVGTI